MSSAKKAAQALLQYDTALAEQIAALPANGRDRAFWRLMVDVRGTWTLSLAAAAAGQTEESVMGALALEAGVIRQGQRRNGNERNIYNPDNNPHFWAWINDDEAA